MDWLIGLGIILVILSGLLTLWVKLDEKREQKKTH